MFIVAGVLYVVLAWIYLFRFLKHRWLMNPSALFIIQQLVFYFGIVPLLDFSYGADQAHFNVICGSLVLFLVGNGFSAHSHPISARQARIWRASPITIEDDIPFNILVYGVVTFSIVICILYYRMVGYNVFLTQMSTIIAGGNADFKQIAAERLASYAGSRYLAAGYVNQFKNILMPLAIALIFARGILKRKKFDVIIALAVSPVALIFLLGTGQRWPVFFAAVLAITFFNVVMPKGSRRKMNFVIITAAGTLFVASTLILGREVKSVQTVGDAREVGVGVIGRFTSDNQVSAVAAFRYVYGQSPKWFDGEWVHGMENLVPGHERRIALANIVFYSLFKDRNGTSPPSIWGTAWYDFNILGVILLPLLLGYLYQYVYYIFITSPKSLGRILVFNGIYVVLGTWAVGAPDAMMNDGLLTMLLLLGLITLTRIMERRGERKKSRRMARLLGYPAAVYPPISIATSGQPILDRRG